MIDCFTFFNGLDILEIRLNCLAPYVEKFVLVESPFTMVGTSKPLYFNENKERFKNFNITHLIVDDHLDHMGEWKPYFYQLDYIMNGLSDIDEESIILLSDFDEIPDLKNYQEGREGVFKQKLYYYYLNVYTGDNNWGGTIAICKKNIIKLSEHRLYRNKMKRLSKFGGWHFSYVCSVEEIIEKIEAFCHQNLNTPEIKGKIAGNKRNLVDPFNRSSKKFAVEMPSGPDWLLDNKEKYEHLFYKKENIV